MSSLRSPAALDLGSSRVFGKLDQGFRMKPSPALKTHSILHWLGDQGVVLSALSEAANQVLPLGDMRFDAGVGLLPEVEQDFDSGNHGVYGSLIEAFQQGDSYLVGTRTNPSSL